MLCQILKFIFENNTYFANSFLYVNFYIFFYKQLIIEDNKLTQQIKNHAVKVAIMAYPYNLKIAQFIKLAGFFVYKICKGLEDNGQMPLVAK